MTVGKAFIALRRTRPNVANLAHTACARAGPTIGWIHAQSRTALRAQEFVAGTYAVSERAVLVVNALDLTVTTRLGARRK